MRLWGFTIRSCYIRQISGIGAFLLAGYLQRALNYTMSGRINGKETGATTLKSVARHVGLSAGTVSSVLNNSPSAAHIPQATRDRIHAAARELNYRPNLLARSLRKQRTYTLGIIANDLGDAYTSLVIAGIEKFLRQNNYFFITGVHHHKRDQFDAYSDMLMQRGVEGADHGGLELGVHVIRCPRSQFPDIANPRV